MLISSKEHPFPLSLWLKPLDLANHGSSQIARKTLGKPVIDFLCHELQNRTFLWNSFYFDDQTK